MDKNKNGSVVLALLFSIIVLGMIAGFFMTSLTRTKNVEDAFHHLSAYYIANAGVSDARIYILQNLPDEAEFQKYIGEGTYKVEIERFENPDAYKSNNGMGNNQDGFDSSNPGAGIGVGGVTIDESAGVDDEKKELEIKNNYEGLAVYYEIRSTGYFRDNQRRLFAVVDESAEIFLLLEE